VSPNGAEKVKEINYIVDVGGNIGATALMFHAAFPNARILALEPMSMNWECLVYNTKDIPEITCRKTAVGSERGHISLSLPDDTQRPDIDSDLSGTSGLFSIFGKGTRTETSTVDLLDNIVTAKVDILKIDVEGAEAEVLIGAKRIMREDRPIVFIELRKANVAMGGHTHKDYNNYFASIGYREVGKYLGDHILVPNEIDHMPWNRAVDTNQPELGTSCE
jgi:FkbM family methyltransferase